jgi:hypothetical protein
MRKPNGHYCFTTDYTVSILLEVRTKIHRCLALLLLIAFGVSTQSLNGQTQLPLKRDLVWSSPGDEIITPEFSSDGSYIVLVTRAYWPDGGDAEGLPDTFFKNLEDKKKRNPRFADPVIKLIALNGQVVCEVRYGWNPSLSPDNKRIIFSEQVRPITGLRELAETQAGNGIRVFDCGTKQLAKLADPNTGYLDNPFLAADGQSVIYTENEAANGAFAGSVGLARFDLQQNRNDSLLNKETVAAVPCPPADSGKSTRESFMCSQVGSPTSSFSRLVFHVAPAGNKVIALVGMPIPAPGDTYLAQNYEVDLVTIYPEKRKILSLGKKSMENLEDATFQVVSGQRVLIFSQYWNLFSLVTGEPLAEADRKNPRRKSIYSPDLKYFLCAEPEGEPNHFVLYRTADGKTLVSLRKMGEVYGAVWSPDSRRFAVVGLPIGSGALNHHEELAVYSVP